MSNVSLFGPETVRTGVLMLGFSRVPAGYYRAEGMIKNVNTIEEYKEIDKIRLLQQAGKTVRCLCIIACEGRLLILVKDMGSYQRRHHILVPISFGFVCHSLLCRLEEV